MSRMFLVAVVTAAMVVAACSSSGGESSGNGGEDSCLEQLADCDAVCIGQYVRTCADDKKGYTYQYCSGQLCKNGLCQTAACTEPLKAVCDPVDPTLYKLCLENMTQETPRTCKDETKCQAGACVDQECDAGDKVCGYKAVLTCADDGQSWQEDKCGTEQYCNGESLTCVDIDPFCLENPLGAVCQNQETRLVCGPTGKPVAEDCGSDEVCAEGFCQPRVCGVTYQGGQDATPTSDAVTDTSTTTDIVLPELPETILLDLPPKDIPPLEVPPKAWVTINGGDFDEEEIKFTSSKQALFIVKDADLQVGMAKGVLMLEIHFQGIEEGVVGNFTSDEPGSVSVWIWMNDGSTDQNEIQWKYQSNAFDVTLDQFDPPGGRAIGTFSGTLEDLTGGPPLELTNGFFDVPRKQ